MISARNITKKFGNVPALADVSLDIKPGEFMFLTGASGSGKTTLLRIFLRELLPDKGTLTIDGVDIAKIAKRKLPLYRRSLGMVFQDFKVLNDRNVFENVALPLEVSGTKPTEIINKVKKSLELVGLTPKSDLFPAQLSGGELQRVAIARAIVANPKLILADEPTGNLDPKTARGIVKLLQTIHADLKTTVIMATHNADIVNANAQRVVNLSEGKVVSDSLKGKYE